MSTRLGLLFGGRSGEHEVSVRSGHAVWKASVDAGFNVVGIGVTRQGEFVYLGDCKDFFSKNPQEVDAYMGQKCFIFPDPTMAGIYVEKGGVFGPEGIKVDVIFPVLHGSYGEDGAVQGLLELAGIPYVGAPVLGSALCMDKDTAKQILAHQGVPHVPAFAVDRFSWQVDRPQVLGQLSKKISYPCFIKPSGSGSSLGVSKVKRFEEVSDALDAAFLYDTKALIEPSQEALMEIECSVMGNHEPVASVPGQILPEREFYDYEAKYVEDTTGLLIPAPLDEELTKRVQEVAVRAFKATCCRGMARVDFFVDVKKREAYVNEINTLPGFTSISMYPKLWGESGLPFKKLVQTLVDLAIEHKASDWKEVRVRHVGTLG